MARIVVNANGTKRYINEAGELHREDGPAVIYDDGTLIWYTFDIQHAMRRSGGSVIHWHVDGTSIVFRPNGYNVQYDNDMEKKWPEF